MICVTSPFEEPLSRTEQARIWARFLDGGTTHSAHASTLPYIMRRCEREKVSYLLQAMPGVGYHIKRAEGGQG